MYVRKQANPLNLKDWLGGLDSNQDTQSQSLVSYQLDDLPADGGPSSKNESQQLPDDRDSHDSSLYRLNGKQKSVNLGDFLCGYCELRREIISPFFMVNSASPHVTRFEVKLASQTMKCSASRTGMSHQRRRTVSS